MRDQNSRDATDQWRFLCLAPIYLILLEKGYGVQSETQRECHELQSPLLEALAAPGLLLPLLLEEICHKRKKWSLQVTLSITGMFHCFHFSKTIPEIYSHHKSSILTTRSPHPQSSLVLIALRWMSPPPPVKLQKGRGWRFVFIPHPLH